MPTSCYLEDVSERSWSVMLQKADICLECFVPFRIVPRNNRGITRNFYMGVLSCSFEALDANTCSQHKIFPCEIQLPANCSANTMKSPKGYVNPNASYHHWTKSRGSLKDASTPEKTISIGRSVIVPQSTVWRGLIVQYSSLWKITECHTNAQDV